MSDPVADLLKQRFGVMHKELFALIDSFTIRGSKN